MYSSYAVAIVVCSSVFCALAILVVGYRFYSRRLQRAPLKADDWLCLAAAIFAVGTCMGEISGATQGQIGADLTRATPAEYTTYMKHTFVIVPASHVSYALVKLSVLELYKRIFFSVKQFRVVANILMAIVSAWMVAVVFGQIFAATPVHHFWKFGFFPYLNYDYNLFVLVNGVLDLSFDVIILCLPLPMIVKLHMTWQKKCQLLMVFWMGVFCIIATAVKVYYMQRLTKVSPLPIPGVDPWSLEEGFAYVAAHSHVWATVEMPCSVIAACLPCFGPLVRSIRAPSFIQNTLASLRSLLSRSHNSNDTVVKPSPSDDWIPLQQDRHKNGGLPFFEVRNSRVPSYRTAQA